MAVSSNPFPLGTKAPDFNLLDTISNKFIELQDIKSDKATVIMFLCNHCPYVKHILKELVKLVKEYQQKGVSFAAVSSNEIINYPEDSPQKMKEAAAEYGFTFPYFYDETQEVARAYDAACTPEFYIFGKNMECKYHGQFDDSRPANEKPVTGNDIRNALENILNDLPIDFNQLPGIGCSIKWKT